MDWLESGLFPQWYDTKCFQDVRNFSGEKNGCDYVRPCKPNWLLACKVIQPDVELVRVSHVIGCTHGKDIPIRLNQGIETKIGPAFLNEALIKPFVRRDRIEHSLHFVSAIWKAEGFGNENLPILEKRVHRAVLGNKIYAHHWYSRPPDVHFSPPAKISLHGNAVDLVRNFELFLREQDAHFAHVCFSQRRGRIALVRQEVRQRMDGKFLHCGIQ